jgi:uncharacterized protein (DUF2345 family)
MTPRESTLALAHGQRLAVEAGHTLRLFGADGGATLTVRITPGGPVLQFSGGLEIQAEGPLALSGQTLALHGREGVAISTGGDLELHAERDLHSVARIQNITADLGNVNLRANDDVRIDGERVMVNCE